MITPGRFQTKDQGQTMAPALTLTQVHKINHAIGECERMLKAAGETAEQAKAAYDDCYNRQAAAAERFTRAGQSGIFLPPDRQRDLLWREYREAAGEVDRLTAQLNRLKKQLSPVGR